mmetsp:Transcript_25031/g.63011  ORF Transcript_25031/g.63011 Transcript_25031/m.63011 type:complete len:463 (-) Transcript_25031:139-1527(-)
MFHVSPRLPPLPSPNSSSHLSPHCSRAPPSSSRSAHLSVYFLHQPRPSYSSPHFSCQMSEPDLAHLSAYLLTCPSAWYVSPQFSSHSSPPPCLDHLEARRSMRGSPVSRCERCSDQNSRQALPSAAQPVFSAASSRMPVQSLASHQVSSHSTRPALLTPLMVVQRLRKPSSPNSSPEVFSHMVPSARRPFPSAMALAAAVAPAIVGAAPSAPRSGGRAALVSSSTLCSGGSLAMDAARMSISSCDSISSMPAGSSANMVSGKAGSDAFGAAFNWGPSLRIAPPPALLGSMSDAHEGMSPPPPNLPPPPPDGGGASSLGSSSLSFGTYLRRDSPLLLGGLGFSTSGGGWVRVRLTSSAARAAAMVRSARSSTASPPFASLGGSSSAESDCAGRPAIAPKVKNSGTEPLFPAAGRRVALPYSRRHVTPGRGTARTGGCRPPPAGAARRADGAAAGFIVVRLWGS